MIPPNTQPQSAPYSYQRPRIMSHQRATCRVRASKFYMYFIGFQLHAFAMFTNVFQLSALPANEVDNFWLGHMSWVTSHAVLAIIRKLSMLLPSFFFHGAATQDASSVALVPVTVSSLKLSFSCLASVAVGAAGFGMLADAYIIILRKCFQGETLVHNNMLLLYMLVRLTIFQPINLNLAVKVWNDIRS